MAVAGWRDRRLRGRRGVLLYQESSKVRRWPRRLPDQCEGQLAIFRRAELHLVVLEIGGERLGRGRIDGAGLGGVELDVVDRALFVLTNTNPPLYTVKKETTVADAPNLDNLKTIVEGFGKLFQTIVTASAGQAQPLPVGAPPPSTPA